MFLLVFWSAILYEASCHWGIKVCTTDKETCDHQDLSKIQKFLDMERIPITYIAVTSPTGNTYELNWLHDNSTSIPEGEKIGYKNVGKVFIVKVRLGRGDLSDAPVYVSKVRLLSCDGEYVQPEMCTLHWNNQGKVEESSRGYWIFDPPKMLYEFTITITLQENDQDNLHGAICEIEVLKPSLYGKRVQLPDKHVVNSSNMSVAIEKCRKQNASLSTTVELDDTETRWIGLMNKSNGPRTDDGVYNTLPSTEVSNLIKTRICHEYNMNNDCKNAVCSVTEVEYYVRENSSDGNLRKVCETDRGIPVSPSSEMEIRFLHQEFPENNLIVAACEAQGYQFEPTVIRNGDTFDCKQHTPVVLSTTGILENFQHRNHNSALVACKRPSEKRRLGTNETWRHTSWYMLPKTENTRSQEIGILFDNNLNNIFPSMIGEPHIITIYPREGMWTDISELRLYTKYNEEYENGYAVIKTTANCSDLESKERDFVLSMSRKDSYKFHQLDGTNCAPNKLNNLKIEWPYQVELTEVQLINGTTEIEINVVNDAILKLNKPITLLCTAINDTYSNLSWYSAKEEMGGKSFASERGWTKALEISESGIYTCVSGEHRKNMNVAWANTCDTADLEKPKHGTIVHDPFIKLGHFADIKCHEGFVYKEKVVCEKKGVFKVSGDYCVSMMGELLDGVMKQKTSEIEAEKISKEILDIVEHNEFMFSSEIDLAVNLLKNITDQSYTDKMALANIFEASNTISRKRVKGEKNLSQIQACLDIVDLIGKNVVVDKSSAFKLAGDGLALTAVDVEQAENDITFALYNETTIDDLQYFDWDVELEGAANSISIPISHAHGTRVWFTVYSESMYKSENVASYIIGASFGQEKSNLTANITLKKLYYGPRDATCMYWEKKTASWSNEGLTKIKETDEYVVCQTNHFTSFSILMTRDDSFIPKIHKSALEIISMAGCAVSCICLIMTIIGLARFSHIRKLTDSIIHMNFSASLLGALSVFLIFIDFTKHTYFCKAVAMMLHYFLLASVSWMFCEALHLYMSVKSIFTNNKHIVLMAVIAWGCPFLMVLFTVLTDFSLTNYTNSKCCWLSDEAMIHWFAVPVILLAILNTVLYAMVLKYIATNARSKKISCISDLRSCFLLLIVLGCTWIFGFFTLLTTKVVFQYLFAISNSLQGFCVFYCYCGSKQYIISAWRSAKEPQPLEEKEITIESKIVTQKDEQQAQRTPSPSPSVSTTQYATPYASTSIMRIPTINNNWYMNDDHF